jgi:chromatin segregation and condensation protein Rec8/ScpA/Scc1 (kleisin family)
MYVEQLRTKLAERHSMLFSELMEQKSRPELIGWFLALLLLLKQEAVSCAQDGEYGDIRILYRENAAASAVDTDLADDFR